MTRDIMTGEPSTNYLKIQPVKQFLDAVDSTLNSNTFFLYLPFLSCSVGQLEWQKKLKEYFENDSFDNDLFLQDSHREWHNYARWSYSDDGEEEWIEWIYDDKKFRRKNEAKIIFYEDDKIEYLVVMLTGEGVIKIPETHMTFYSPHRTGISKVVATNLVKDFIEAIFAEETWYLWTINPDFLWSNEQLRDLSQDEILTHDTHSLTYFEGEGWRAIDSATLLISDTKAFLLLTNGLD